MILYILTLFHMVAYTKKYFICTVCFTFCINVLFFSLIHDIFPSISLHWCQLKTGNFLWALVVLVDIENADF